MSGLHTTSEYIQMFDEALNRFVSSVSGLPDQMIQRKPNEQAWSIHEILCHMEEAIPFWIAEIKKAVENPETRWGRTLDNEQRLAAVNNASARNTSAVIENLQSFKQEFRQMMSAFSEGDLQKQTPSKNPKFGIKPVAYILDHFVLEHFETHKKQIERNINQS